MQIEPVGQGAPPMLQLDKAGKETVGVRVTAARVEEEKRRTVRSCIVLFSFTLGEINRCATDVKV